jgi:hypothetical protein
MGLVDGRQIWKNSWQESPAFAAEVATKAEQAVAGGFFIQFRRRGV